MERLWAPWRMAYILAEEKPEGCLFCQRARETECDREHYVLQRAEYCYVMLNAYPYNNGHLMVVPYLHVADLIALPEGPLGEMMRLTAQWTCRLRRVMSPDGFNIGLNLGEVAGAGIVEHIHLHIVPRWQGDTNFMPVVGETKVIPEHLLRTYDKLHAALEAENKGEPT
ncbi:MAG TPA: HIT domain-containing protein [Armatimonadetes bacterium]|nr:HIT domain-containing protein [Armatimonadota bacterium]